MRYFRKSLDLDGSLVMARYGMALAIGTNMNIAIDDTCQAFAHEQITLAASQLKQTHVTEMESDLISSLVVRYPSPHFDNDQSDSAYRAAMAALYLKYPDSPDIACIYVDSVINMFPFALWRPDGSPTDEPHSSVALAVLDRGLEQHPQHIGLNHYNIHAREGLATPASAMKSAELFDRINISAGESKF